MRRNIAIGQTDPMEGRFSGPVSPDSACVGHVTWTSVEGGRKRLVADCGVEDTRYQLRLFNLISALLLYCTVLSLSIMTLYAAAAPARIASQRAAAVSRQCQRSFSAARPLSKEIQDAYILSASRTPTAKVGFLSSSSE